MLCKVAAATGLMHSHPILPRPQGHTQGKAGWGTLCCMQEASVNTPHP